MNRTEFRKLVEAVNARADEFAIRLLGKPTLRSGRELRFFPNQRLSVIVSGPNAGRWKDFVDDVRGDLLDLHEYVTNQGKAAAIDFAKSFLSVSDIRDLPEVDTAAIRAKREQELKREEKKRVSVARMLWNDAGAAGGTVVEGYLAGRGIPLSGDLPEAVRHRRFTADDFTANGIDPAPFGTDGIEALVVAATDDKGEVRAVQQVLLHQGRKAPADLVGVVKRTNGILHGAAVRLDRPRDVLVLAEGPETGLSVRAATGIPTWVVLGSSNYTRITVPKSVRELMIAVDLEPGGAGLVAAVDAASHWTLQGLRVGLALPETPDLPYRPAPEDKGRDHNDLLKARGVDAVLEAFDRAAFVDTPMVGANETAVMTREPRGALALWASTGAFVRAVPKGWKGSRVELPDHVKRVVIALDAGYDRQLDDCKEQVKAWTKAGLEVRVVHLPEKRWETLWAGGEGAAAVRHLVEHAAPSGSRPPVGTEQLAGAPADGEIILCDRRDQLEAARALFPRHAVLAPFGQDPATTDWTVLAGRAVTVAPVHSPEGTLRAARMIAALRRDGVGPVKLFTYPLIAPRGDQFVHLHSRRPQGYDLAAMQRDGWTAESLEKVGDLAHSVGVLVEKRKPAKGAEAAER